MHNICLFFKGEGVLPPTPAPFVPSPAGKPVTIGVGSSNIGGGKPVPATLLKPTTTTTTTEAPTTVTPKTTTTTTEAPEEEQVVTAAPSELNHLSSRVLIHLGFGPVCAVDRLTVG